jgi:hypothetical protein
VKFSLQKNVYQTLCWFDIFDQPATLAEIHKFLFRAKTTQTEIKKILEKDSRIEQNSDLYFLRKKNINITKRKKREKHAKKLWRKIDKYNFIFRLTPFLQCVAIVNTLAMGFPEKNSDIDLFIITKKNRLFIARAFLTFWTQIFGMRRHGKKIRGKFCLSFFIADDYLNLEKIKLAPEDPYLAFWIATLIPIYGDASKFFAANTWIKKYFPNLDFSTKQLVNPMLKRGVNGLLSGKFEDKLENFLKNWQLNRARKKQKNQNKNSVIISESMLKFHENDRREEFYKKWKNNIECRG